MDSVFSFTITATSMKDCGKEISATVRALTGAMKPASSAVSTLVTGMKIRSTAEALSSTRTETDTMDTGSQECLREKAE